MFWCNHWSWANWNTSRIQQTHDEQDIYLGGFITIILVKQRRSSQIEEVAKLGDASFSYRIRVCDGYNNKNNVPVCAKALS